MPRQTTTEQNRGGQTVVRVRYKADAATCAACPLRELCMQPGAKHRQITRDQHEAHRESLARRMPTPEGQAKYAKRRHAGERPFAVIKHRFGPGDSCCADWTKSAPNGVGWQPRSISAG